jgi:hypothetical protein
LVQVKLQVEVDGAHAGTELGGEAQALHRVPHESSESSATQRCPHACCPAGHAHASATQAAP